jgi:hypothetical protein
MQVSLINRNIRLAIIAVVILAAIVIIFQLSPIPQDPTFHNFADNTGRAGIPNFWNVVSNLGFLIVGLLGFVIVLRANSPFGIKVTYLVLTLSVVLTSIGSAYYHLQPNNDRLVFDRLPMTFVFMAFLSAAISQAISRTWGLILLLPLICLGGGSVLWWNYTEKLGAGDLRFYGLVQFLPMLLVPLIFVLFPPKENRRIWSQFGWIIGWYTLSKIFEHFDSEILQITHVISGHSIKHITASIATIYFIAIYKKSEHYRKQKS